MATAPPEAPLGDRCEKKQRVAKNVVSSDRADDRANDAGQQPPDEMPSGCAE